MESYITTSEEKIQLRKDFYPFLLDDRAGERTKVVINKGNKCVLENDLSPSTESVPAELSKLLKSISHWFCGYVMLHHSEVPKDFAYGYNRSGLQLLNVHGGITYSQIIHFEKDKEKWEAININAAHKFEKLREEFSELNEKNREEYFLRREDITDWEVDSKAQLGFEWIIFGFDTNHYNDSQNKNLKDPDYIFQLTLQMEQQIKAFVEIYEEYNTHSQDIKKILIDKIRTEGEIDCDLGLGAILKMLGGDEF